MTLAGRKSKFAHLCRIMKDIDVLMEDENNAHTVSRKLSTEFTEVYMEFCSLNETVKEYMSEEDMIKDQKTWYESRTKHLNGFVKDVGRWLKRAAEQAKEARQYDSEVSPADSASMVSLSHKLGKSPHSRAASVVSSNASSTKLKYEAERAALIAQATALKRKQEIDRELAQLQAKKEELELQTAIDAANAKIEVLGLHESDVQEQEQGRPRVVRNLHAEAAFSDDYEKGDEDDVAFLLQRPTRHSPQPRPHYCKKDEEWPEVSVNRISVACLDDLIHHQMKLDFPEAQQAEKMEMSVEDKRFMDSVSKSVQLIDGHFSIGLPLKAVDAKFPNNRMIAVQRAEHLRRKFMRNEQFCKDYVKFMSDMLEKGYAEKIPQDEVHNDEDETRT
ncbi:hypothetical protein MHYP_G00107140 [Metynnis hypsauchen]